MATCKLAVDLPGHQDEVFAVCLPPYPPNLLTPEPMANSVLG